MNRKLKIALNVGLWTGLLVYIVFAANYCSRRENEIRCTGLNVIVRDSNRLGFVTPAIVRNVLVNDGIRLTGMPMDSINLLDVERSVASRGFVKFVSAYSSIDGKVNIEIEQRQPVMRVQTENGYNFYVSDDHYVLPIQRYFFVDAPIVTGIIELPFGKDFVGALPDEKTIQKKSFKNYAFLYNLINFVRFLDQDPFWGDQIVQINVLPENEVELVPRVGNALILLGSLEDYGEKLDKLFRFYRKGLNYEGWNKYSYINIKFKNQVVCTK